MRFQANPSRSAALRRHPSAGSDGKKGHVRAVRVWFLDRLFSLKQDSAHG